MDINTVNNEIEAAEAQLAAARGEQAVARAKGDIPRARQLRVTIENVVADLQDLHAARDAHLAYQASAERQAERAGGRRAAQEALSAMATLQSKAVAVDRLFAQLAAAVLDLRSSARTCSEHAHAALRAHAGRDHQQLHARASHIVQPAALNTGEIALSIARHIAALLDATPCALRLAAEHIIVNPHSSAATRAVGPAPLSFPAAVERAAGKLATQLADLLTEPT